MKYNISVLLFLLIALTTSGQNFSGVVLDLDTKQPIAFAEVYFVDLKTGTITDTTGYFELKNFTHKNIHLQISSIGYTTIDRIIKVDSTELPIFYLEEAHLELDEVLISAPSGRLQRENIVSIEHRKMAELQETAPLTLTEAISSIPGVEQTTTGSGIGKPIIRGLSGNRIVTYAQGIRIENQQWGDEHGLGVGEVGIEGVEVIKGPASLLYGSDALGGVLYFVDERYASQNSLEVLGETKFFSNTLGSITNVGFKIHQGRLKYNLFGTYASHTDYQIPNAQRVFNTRFDEKNIKSSVGFNTNQWIANLRYSFLQNNFGIVEDSIFTLAADRNFFLPFQSIDNHNASFENTLFAGNSKLNITLGYTHNYRKEFEDETDHQALGLQLSTYTYNVKWYSPIYKDRFDFVIGSQGMAQQNLNNGEEVLIPDANTRDIGAFGLANLKFNQLQLQAGIRSDYRNIHSQEMHLIHHHEGEEEEEEKIIPSLEKTYAGITFSGGAAYKRERTKFRANISSGFRAPNTSELLSDGVHHGTNRYIKGNANLTHENATQVDFSFDYHDDHLDFSINPFYNSIQNYSYLSPTELTLEGSQVFEYLQTKAFLYGGEAGFHYHPHQIHWLHLASNLSAVYAEDNSGNALPLIPQTNVNSTISAELPTNRKVSLKKIYAQHIYKFQQNRIGIFETATPDYHLINVGINLEVATSTNPFQISAGVRNLFNSSYIDHLSRFKSLDISNQGINFYIGLKIKLNKQLAG